MKRWLFAILCILLVVLNLAFIIFMKQMANELYTLLLGLRYVGFLIWSSVFAIVTTIISLCILTDGIKRRVLAKSAFFGISCIVTLAIGFIFFRYLPKYTRGGAYAAVEANHKFTLADDFMNGSYCFSIEANPFFDTGYSFNCTTADQKPCFVNFNPIDASYEYTYTNNFSMQTANFMINDYGIGFTSDHTVCFHIQITKIREEHDREMRLTHISDDRKMAEQQLLALKEMDEQKLRDELKELVQIYLKHYDAMRSEQMPPSSELVISFNISGVDIATYQDGNITLK